MKHTSELNSSIDNICRLCATQQDNGQPLCVGGSEELDNLVKNICCLLGVECKDTALHPKWLCSSCHMDARSTEQFIQLVRTGQKKLMELLGDCHDELITKDFTETDTVTAHDQTRGNAESSQVIVVNDRKRCTKYKKRIKQSQKFECIEKPIENLDARKKRTRRRPQRLLEEIELKACAKQPLRDPPLPVKLNKQIDSCALITSQPIAELRTATGNALGEIVEVESNKDKDNLFSTKTYFICEFCKDVFSRQKAFLKHIETHKNCIYECKECLQAFSSNYCFAHHQALTGHAGVGIIEDIGAEKDIVHKNTEHSRLSAGTSSAAINIVVGANGQITSIDQMDSDCKNKDNDSLAEEAPGDVLSTEDTFKVQYNDCAKKLTNSKYACVACTKTFDYPYAVRRHYKLVHVAERAHKCSVCPAAFKTKYNYDLHLATHTGEKHFTCNFCPKSFKTKHEWKVHNRVHTGEKPFKCLLCLKTFANRCNLVTHKRVHTGERPYKCSNCEAAFTTASHLKKHKQVHLRIAQRKLKVEQDSDASKKQATPKESSFYTDAAATQALVKFNSISDNPLSLLKPKISNKNSVESKILCSELPAMPCITNVSILPAIAVSSDSNVSPAGCIKSLQSKDLCRELPRKTNFQILPGIAANTDSLKLSMADTSNSVTENLTSSISADSAHAQFKFQCPSCQKKFKQSGALRKHQRTHTGERPYKCPMCPKSFADPSNFKKHRILHKNATHALKNVCVSKSSTMQELLQMLAEQSVTIKSHAAHSSTYAASDPDPDGLETFSRSLACASDFADADEILNEHNSSFSAVLGNFASWNRFDNALPPADMALNNSLMPFTDTEEMETSISSTTRANQLVCISYQDPINPISKTTTYYVVN